MWYQEWNKNPKQLIQITEDFLQGKIITSVSTNNSNSMSKPIFTKTLNFGNSFGQYSNDIPNDNNRMEEETLELKVVAINKNETLLETLDETRMELDEFVLNLLNKNFSVYDLDSSTYLTSENVSSFTSIDIPDANLQTENEQNSSINVTYSGPDSHYTSDELKAREDYFASLLLVVIG